MRSLALVVGLVASAALAQEEVDGGSSLPAPVTVASPPAPAPVPAPVVLPTPVLPTPVPVAAPAAPVSDSGPRLSGNVRLRLEDGHILGAPAADFTKNAWFGPDIRDATLFQYSARLEVSGKLGGWVTYGARLMLRNFKTPAFSYPAFESGFGNTAVVADLYYLSFAPVEGLTLSLGKHPMLLTRHANFFWDVDVQPVGASEQYQHALPGGPGVKHTLGANLGQWLPLPNLRPGPDAFVLVYQGFYRGTYADEYDVEAAVGATQINGLDRIIANTAIGGALSYTLVTNADGTQSLQSTPKLDFKAENDPTLIGYNPTFLDLHFSASKRNVLGRPLAVQFGLVRNLSRGNPSTVTQTFEGQELNAVLAGFTWGKVKKAWSWQVGYSYIYKGVASVIDGWTDDGHGSDLRGHVVTAEIAFTEGVTLQATWRLLQDADGRDKSGKALSDALKNAYSSNLRIVLGATF